jgi:Holliday junction DNA helicase RuvB
MENMLNPELHHEDRENVLRPSMLNEFQGQKKLKENLGIYIQAAKGRIEALDHIFLSGPPGLGKTTLAGIIAHEMGAEFKVTSAPALEKPKDLAGLLTTIKEGTVFFIDELHRLKPALEEMLYIAMEDFEIDWIIGQGPAARSVRIPLPRFTLIGATTKPGNVASPLYTRFGIPIRMNFYDKKEIKKIIIRSAGILEIDIEDDAAEALARCSRGTPRVANRLLRRMRDFADVNGRGIITQEIIQDGLHRMEIDDIGLEQQDRKILQTIIRNYGGGPVGAETLAISVGEGIESLEDFYEPYMIQIGFLNRTPRGRMVTDLAYKHLGYEIPAQNSRGEQEKGKNEDQGILF